MLIDYCLEQLFAEISSIKRPRPIEYFLEQLFAEIFLMTIGLVAMGICRGVVVGGDTCTPWKILIIKFVIIILLLVEKHDRRNVSQLVSELVS